MRAFWSELALATVILTSSTWPSQGFTELAVYEKLYLTTTADFGQLLLNIETAYVRTKSLSDALAHYTRAEAVYRAGASGAITALKRAIQRTGRRATRRSAMRCVAGNDVF